jgi:hypothetical protein
VIQKIGFTLLVLATVVSNAMASARTVNFSGTVQINGCSGVYARFEFSSEDDEAIILSAGHCAPLSPRLAGNEYAYHHRGSSQVTFLNANGSVNPAPAYTAELLYATMRSTDVSIYRMGESYRELSARVGTGPLTIASAPARIGDPIQIISAKLFKTYSCSISQFVYELHEGEYTWDNSIRYSRQGCEVVGGTSGSPVIDLYSGKIVGLNTTGNGGGAPCSDSSPCEVSSSGEVYSEVGLNYAQELYQIETCIDRQHQFSLATPGCALFH